MNTTPPPPVVGPLNAICIPHWEPNYQGHAISPPPSFLAVRHFNYQDGVHLPWFRRRPNTSSRFFVGPGHTLVNHEDPTPSLDRFSSCIHARHANDLFVGVYGAHVFLFPGGPATPLMLKPLADFLVAHEAHFFFDIYPRPAYEGNPDRYRQWASDRIKNGILLQKLTGRRVYCCVTPQNQFADPNYTEGVFYTPATQNLQLEVLRSEPDLGACIFGGIASAKCRVSVDAEIPAFAAAVAARTLR